MRYQEHIQRALDFIEAHLQRELTLERCAAAAGYSPYHFSRIFHSVTGLAPMDYVRKRRLACAAADIAAGTEPLVDIAMRWGFESTETFLRAFAAEHGITPGRYRGSGISLHVTEPFRLHGEPMPIGQPEVIAFPGGTVCGYGLVVPTDARHGLVPQFWNRYHTQGLARTLPGCPSDGWYDDVGCSLPRAADGSWRYVCGIWSDRPGPTGSELTRIPPGLYAVFTTPPADALTFVETIHRTWDHAIGHWLPHSAYRMDAARPSFETYCEKSRTFTEKICIPIKQKEADHAKTAGALHDAAH